uniref:Ribosomal protein S3 n=1 Tax=Pseudevernia consocians TaxID=136281 RepID=A0A345WFT5_9LECA|nr:ribosomal protein S3 [Pseudevernia consocians]AXJ91928.1 ribosomal protein S3 [Pseudevernia consocians]
MNKIPMPNSLVYVALKSEISVLNHPPNLYNSSSDMLNVFSTRLKKNNDNHNEKKKVKLEDYFNYIGKARHYPPANKEWFNSIYAYNKNTIKLLPTLDKVTLKLVKSYFNFYSRKLEKKIKSRRLRVRGRRLSTNRILISRAELKHTNDKVVVTIYVYNRQKKYYFNKIMRLALLMFKLPFIDRWALYEEIYNRKRKLQNLKVDNSTDNLISLKSKLKSQFSDLLERSFLNTDPKDSIYKLKDFKLWCHDASHPQARPQNSVYCNYPLFLVNTILRSIRNKYVSGIRLEVAGRLTRRNKAARSLFKLRYKGNIKNMDSSYKGLSAVLLRGFAKSNLQYTKLKSRIRIGSFGLKGWVSSSS